MRRLLTMAMTLSSALAVNTSFAALPAAAAEQNRACKVVDVTAFANRVHVRCTPIAGGGLLAPPTFFAVELNNPLADKLVMLASQALITNRTLQLTYEGLPGQNPAGCLVSDCRRLMSVSLQ